MAHTQKGPEALTWASFPAEIRLMILSAIAQQKHSGWASLASVCRAWQYVLEKHNFYKIKLQVSCLDDFEQILSSKRRNIIHHICFTIELPRYTSTCCSKRRSQPINITSITSKGIWKLFSILSSWRPVNHLALEINVYSPSDCDHWFKNFQLSSDNTENGKDTLIPQHDPHHGWIHGQQVEAPPKSAVSRIFRPIRLVFHNTLPRVYAVTCFIIRRQLRRSISPSGLVLLMSRLDRLEHISFEPWAPYEAANREFYDRGMDPFTPTALIYLPLILGNSLFFCNAKPSRDSQQINNI